MRGPRLYGGGRKVQRGRDDPRRLGSPRVYCGQVNTTGIQSGPTCYPERPQDGPFFSPASISQLLGSYTCIIMYSLGSFRDGTRASSMLESTLPIENFSYIPNPNPDPLSHLPWMEPRAVHMAGRWYAAELCSPVPFTALRVLRAPSGITQFLSLSYH